MRDNTVGQMYGFRNVPDMGDLILNRSHFNLKGLVAKPDVHPLPHSLDKYRVLSHVLGRPYTCSSCTRSAGPSCMSSSTSSPPTVTHVQVQRRTAIGRNGGKHVALSPSARAEPQLLPLG